MIKTKSKCFAKFKEFKVRVETQLEKMIKVFKSNNGGEFMSEQFEEFLKEYGLAKQILIPYTLQ